MQRAATHIASLRDIDDAIMVGKRAVEEVNKGTTGKMVIITSDFKTDVYDIDDIANVEKKVPIEWIDTENNMLKDEFIKYAKPLIQGELIPIFVDGVPKHLIR